MFQIGLWVIFLTTPEASSKTCEPASWDYDPAISEFDSSLWTSCTDFVIAVGMAAFIFTLLSRLYQHDNTDRLCIRLAGLASMCMISITIGGTCHLVYGTVESRNSLSFRILWTLCVGAIPLSNIWMGCCASEIVRKFQESEESSAVSSPMFQRIPLIPEYFWCLYGLTGFAFMAMGWASFQRPACDLFVVAVSQAVPSLYIMIVLVLLDHPKVRFSARILGVVGLYFHIPLLPLYPVLVQSTDWSLGAINTLLHSWLAVSWSLQAYSLQHIIRSTLGVRIEDPITPP